MNQLINAISNREHNELITKCRIMQLNHSEILLNHLDHSETFRMFQKHCDGWYWMTLDGIGCCWMVFLSVPWNPWDPWKSALTCA